MRRASVKELASSQESTFDTDDPKSSCASHENLLSVGSKRKIPGHREALRARKTRWKRINGDGGQQHGHPDKGDRRPPPSST